MAILGLASFGFKFCETIQIPVYTSSGWALGYNGNNPVTTLEMTTTDSRTKSTASAWGNESNSLCEFRKSLRGECKSSTLLFVPDAGGSRL
jgi:hypothetical protein